MISDSGPRPATISAPWLPAFLLLQHFTPPARFTRSATSCCWAPSWRSCPGCCASESGSCHAFARGRHLGQRVGERGVEALALEAGDEAGADRVEELRPVAKSSW